MEEAMDSAAEKKTMAKSAEDSADMKLKSVTKGVTMLVQKATCTYVKIEKDDAAAPYYKPAGVPEVPEEGTSVDPPNPSPAPPLPAAGPDFSQLLAGAETEAMSKADPEDVPKAGESGSGDTADMEQLLADLGLRDPTHYHMGHRNRGRLLLFNVVGSGDHERKGTGKDADLMVETFERMHFKVEREDNPTAETMITKLKEVASRDHTDKDCVAVGILTHGQWTLYRRESNQEVTIADTLQTADGFVLLKDLTEPLREKNCHKSLRGKPKLFFIQSCRGAKLGERAEYYDPSHFVFLPKPTMPKFGPLGVDAADATAQPEEGKEALVQPEEGKEATAQSEEVKEATVQSGEGKEATVQSGDGKEATVQSGEGKEATAQSGEGKEATVQSGEGKEATAQSGEGKEATVQSGDGKEATVQSGEGKEATAQSGEGKGATAQPDEAVAENTGPEDVEDHDIGEEDRQVHSLPEDMPIYKDFLIAWSTAPGYFSFRNEDKGSIFMQTLCRYLNHFHGQADLLTMLTWCNSDIAHQFQSYAPSKPYLHEKKQMPWFFSRLTKELVFTPKPAVAGGQ